MVEKRNAEEHTRFGKPLGHRSIGIGWSGVTRRMVVGSDDRAGVRENRGLEDLPRVNWTGSAGTDGDLVDADDAVLAVEKNRQEVFAVPASGMRLKERKHVRGRSDCLTDRPGAFADKFNANEMRE